MENLIVCSIAYCLVVAFVYSGNSNDYDHRYLQSKASQKVDYFPEVNENSCLISSVLSSSAESLIRRFGNAAEAVEQLEIAAAEEGMNEDGDMFETLSNCENYSDLIQLEYAENKVAEIRDSRQNRVLG